MKIIKTILLVCTVFSLIYISIPKVKLYINYINNKLNIVNRETKSLDISYKHEFALLNKSFKRDLDRSLNLYSSFEKYFVSSSAIPFFVVVPESDLELFKNKFDNAKVSGNIKNLPTFYTEEVMLKMCGEPDVTDNGNITQQVVKLCFGTTAIARHYIVIDSDTYFTKPFDYKKLLFSDDNKISTVAKSISSKKIQNPDGCSVTWYINKFTNAKSNYTCLDFKKFIRNFYGNKLHSQKYYDFISCYLTISSDAIIRMKGFIKNAGISSFAQLINTIPFEGQWYGEYMLQYENFIPEEVKVNRVYSPDECIPEDGGDNYYGVCFQSVTYENNDIVKQTNEGVVYKRPAHCK